MRLTREQVRQTLVAPIICIDNKKSQIESRKENFLFCSTGCEHKAFRNTVIVDSTGQILKIERAFPVGGVLLWTSLKHLTPLRELEPEIKEDVSTISVHGLKELVINAISKNKRVWSSLDTFANISKNINELSTHKDIIIFFDPRLK